MGKLPHYHVLNFFYDDNGCSLSALVHGERYHVVADSKNLQDRSNAGKKISREFRKRLEQSKDAQADDREQKVTAPLFVQEDEDSESDEGKDSAVDVEEQEEEEDDSPDEPSKSLERWMLSPFKEVFPKNVSKKSTGKSVQEWYHCPTHYYDLRIQDGKLQAQLEDYPAAATQKRTDALIPAMGLPKYLRNLDIPILPAADLTVLSESDEIAPIHPTLVKYQKKEYFLKVVDNTQHAPLKRELQVMKRIEAEGLQNEFRVPLLRGLVHFHDDEKNIMGFIMDAITTPTPLTKMLDTGVDEDKRLKWADEAARMVDVLHQHDIIWGDAKGDNFVVDQNEELWIIDFGGSYTEGWIDEKLKETEEGDEQGVTKVWNGLVDPEQNTVDPDEEGEEEDGGDGDGDVEQEEVDETKALRREVASCKDWEDHYEKTVATRKSSSKKRKASDCGDWESGYEMSLKQLKMEKEDDGLRYCYCNGPDSGRMLACDGEKCERQWFHFGCVGIDEAPKGKWFCEGCKEG
ncbi:hypothetical protein M409DRAFT_18528 [Zasmidium cellare ATCC 36951]|uniref:PHD-type domain-containing protein n=1 Tax=Zasmidium cellare ATCC 36951 TaxID=1080233 RepID=A0A6A6CZU2_ZASCE|nr:uncharacterized protein M409DRAFT_18528 [Zasmidium cellare ATCC 36951]KAF2171412.1 hypothetical protein M409DRAFT_18528 [Zasmidium cellare ATCC 36951]